MIDPTLPSDSGRGNLLPPDVRNLAKRLGAVGGPVSSVRLTQRGTLRDRPSAREMRFRASESIHLQQLQFTWCARVGPFGCVSVIDALKDGDASLDVRAFGRLKIAGMGGGPAATKAETMRYLAELAWAPDAILRNPALDWTIVDSKTLRVGAGKGLARGEVELRLDNEGRIGSVWAGDRPRLEGSSFVERPWHGRFFDYRRHQGRWLPFAGEVGWVVGGEAFIVWRGGILSWSIG